MKILNLRSGISFKMGKSKNWRVIHPDMGAKWLTLNYGIYEPGQEFTQHFHDQSEDMIVVFEGGGSIRQGDIFTPVTEGEAIFVPSGEIHGTVNTSGKSARFLSFQSPPDLALYRGERDKSSIEILKPKPGHRSAIQIITMAKGGPIFNKPGNWRSVISPQKGSRHLALDYIQLINEVELTHETESAEEIYIVFNGEIEINSGDQIQKLKKEDVIYLKKGEAFSLKHVDIGPATLIHCYKLE